MGMPSIRFVCGTLLMCGSTWGPAEPTAAAEDAVRCDCWYGGYDDDTQDQGGIDFCNDPPPGTKLDECARLQMHKLGKKSLTA
jgi:hypothetical protein